MAPRHISDHSRSRFADLLMLSTSPGRLTGLEGLRGFAVILVFFVHYELVIARFIPEGSLTQSLSQGIHNAGSTGVDIFYVLSGFLIYGGLMMRPQPFRPYMARRIQRIYPTFLFVLGLYVLLSMAFPSESKLGPNPLTWPVTILVNALLLPGVLPIDRMITVAGTLSFEMLFYITIPWVIGRFGLRDRTGPERLKFWTRVGLIMAVVILPVNSPYQRTFMFLGGILLWELLERRRRDERPPDPTGVAVAGTAGIVIALITAYYLGLGEYGGIPRTVILFVTLPPFVGATIVSGQYIQTAASATPLRALGNISYSYYLMHGLILKMVEEGLDTWFPDVTPRSFYYWALIIPCFALTVVGSFVVYVFVEKRFSIDRRPLPIFDRVVTRVGSSRST